MYVNGPYVPLQCPVEREGIVDSLKDSRFTLHVEDYPGQMRTEVFGSFYGQSEEDNLKTGVINVSSKSGIAQQARRYRLHDEAVVVEGGPRLEALRIVLCNQVSECHGVTKGQCWALGQVGLFNAMDQVISEEKRDITSQDE